MAPSQPRVSTLVAKDSDFEEVLTVVWERSEGGDVELTWTDVRDGLSSGEWGRLIEAGILVGGDDGFAVADPDAIRQIVDEDDAIESEDRPHVGSDPSSMPDLDDVDMEWSRLDKIAAASAGIMFLGYFIPQERNVLAHLFNGVFGILDSALPFILVILSLSLLTGLYSALLQANLRNTEAMEAIQRKMQDIQERKQEAKEDGDEERLEAIQEEQREAIGSQTTMMKVQFRPTVWIMLLTVPVFLWMRWKIRGGHVDPTEMHVLLPLVGNVGLREGLFGPMPTWIVWYFLCSMGFGQIVRKSVDLSPQSSTQNQ